MQRLLHAFPWIMCTVQVHAVSTATSNFALLRSASEPLGSPEEVAKKSLVAVAESRVARAHHQPSAWCKRMIARAHTKKPQKHEWANVKLVSMFSYIAQSDTLWVNNFPGDWLPDDGVRRESAAKCFADLLYNSKTPVVLFIERAYLNPFISKVMFRATPPVPYVILAVNGDEPLTHELQDRLRNLKGLRAVYASNLHVPKSDSKAGSRFSPSFHPMPFGLGYHAFFSASTGVWEPQVFEIRQSALAWEKRDGRLFLTAETLQHNPIRGLYEQELSKPAYKDLVVIRPPSARNPISVYLKKISEHKAVLSPPGGGYDCHRTWEALAVGSVPLVLWNESFDKRLFEHTGVRYIPHPSDLSPAILKQILSNITNPAKYAYKLNVSFWRTAWHSHFE
mmetsp:Transcript_72381/g.132485  ORF Transcript_72381/g.132485 Transcript_72381/m.132485 type:complete len:394 (+) Transcript_72381:80-1261(+)